MNRIKNIRRGARLAALVLTLAVFSPLPARAGINRWTNRGLDGLAIQSLAVDPSNPSRIYAAAGSDGLFRTADGGKNWIGVTGIGDIGVNGIGGFVGKVAIDAQAPDTLYAISGKDLGNSLILRTTDGGNKWTVADWNYPVVSVIVDPGKQGVVYAGHHGGSVSVSHNRGATWSSRGLPFFCWDPFCGANVTSLALDPTSPSTIYAGVDADYDYPVSDQLFKSTDAGSTWSVSDRGLGLASVYTLAVDPGDSSRVLAGTSNGIFQSLDSGGNWSATSPSLIRALVFDPRSPSVVYAGSYGEGVLRSPDGGLHWRPFNPGLSDLQVRSLVFDSDGVFQTSVDLN